MAFLGTVREMIVVALGLDMTNVSKLLLVTFRVTSILLLFGCITARWLENSKEMR